MKLGTWPERYRGSPAVREPFLGRPNRHDPEFGIFRIPHHKANRQFLCSFSTALIRHHFCAPVVAGNSVILRYILTAELFLSLSHIPHDLVQFWPGTAHHTAFIFV